MDAPNTQDLQNKLSEVATRQDLAALLREVHVRAGKPSLRTLDGRTRFDGVRLAKSTVSDMLRGLRFPSQEVMLAFLRECGGVDGDQTAPWKRAWGRIAGDVNEQQQLTELHAKLAEAEHTRPREPIKSGEQLESGGNDGQDRDPVRAGVRLLTTRIIDGEPGHRPGDVLRLDVVMDQVRGGRELALDVLQFLQGRGMVTHDGQAGATVRPLPEWQWNLFDPEVVQWRLESELSSPQESLEELRWAVEPRAAFLAAQRASGDVRRRLIRLAVELKTLAENPQFKKGNDEGVACRERFRAVDEQLHRTIITSSGNDLLHALAEPVVKALNFRITKQWEGAESEWARRAQQFAYGNPPVDSRAAGATEFPPRPKLLAMWLHYGVVHAIEQRRSQAAETFARAIIAEYHRQLDDPLLRHALGLALCELKLSAFEEADRQPFFDAVKAVAAPNDGAPVEPTAAPQEKT